MNLLDMMRNEEPMLTLVFADIPPSGNNYKGIQYNRKTGKPHFFLRPTAARFKQHAVEVLSRAAPFWKPLEWEIAIHVQYFITAKTRLDLDNHLKVINDSLNKRLWKDDSQIVQCFVEKIVVIPQRGQKAKDVKQTVMRIYY